MATPTAFPGGNGDYSDYTPMPQRPDSVLPVGTPQEPQSSGPLTHERDFTVTIENEKGEKEDVVFKVKLTSKNDASMDQLIQKTMRQLQGLAQLATDHGVTTPDHSMVFVRNSKTFEFKGKTPGSATIDQIARHYKANLRDPKTQTDQRVQNLAKRTLTTLGNVLREYYPKEAGAGRRRPEPGTPEHETARTARDIDEALGASPPEDEDQPISVDFTPLPEGADAPRKNTEVLLSALEQETIDAESSVEIEEADEPDARTPSAPAHLSGVSIRVETDEPEKPARTKRPAKLTVEVQDSRPFVTHLHEVGGFTNGVNTCYIAGVLQSLFSIPKFYDTYLEKPIALPPLKLRDKETEASFESRKNQRKIDLKRQEVVRQSLVDLYLRTRRGDTINDKEMDALRTLHKANGWKPTLGDRGHQDGQEYCQFLLDTLGIPLFDYSKELLSDGDVIRRKEFSYSDTMLRIEFPINPQKQYKLSELLLDEQTFIDGGERGEHQGAQALCLLRMDRSQLPLMLPIHLKRNKIDQNRRPTKITSSVTFPEQIAVPLKDDPKSAAVYTLCSCLIQSGGADGGHYYSYAKERTARTDQEQWVEMNDGRISVQREGAVTADMTTNGYVYFYRFDSIQQSG